MSVPNSTLNPQVLATDLDGTLVPLDGNPDNLRDLDELAESLQRHRVPLLYVTGRHLASVMEIRQQFRLPRPDWIICDVGTSLYHRSNENEWVLDPAYTAELERRLPAATLQQIAHQLSGIDGLTRQESKKQGRYKLSFYADADALEELGAKIRAQFGDEDFPCQMVSSIDPFNGDGLIDLLPAGVHKSFALDSWVSSQFLEKERVAFAGDSGNDVAALTAGYAAILVSNARPEVVRDVVRAHRQEGWPDRLFLASQPATSGVLEGCRHWGMID